MVLCADSGTSYANHLTSAVDILADTWKVVMQQTLWNCFRHAGFTLDTETASSPAEGSMCDLLLPADIAVDELRAAAVSIPAGTTFEGFADTDEDPVLCAELSDDVIVCQATEDSNDSDTNNEESAPTQPTSSEFTRALMTLLPVYSDNTTLAEIEANIIVGKRNAVQKEISDFFCAKVLTSPHEVVPAKQIFFFVFIHGYAT